MLDFVERVGRWYDDMLRLPKSQAQALLKLGAGVVRLLPGKKSAPAGGD